MSAAGWVFYVNVPIAVIVIALAARTILEVRSGRKPTIDYLGCLFGALGATGLPLATSWGGTQYAWGSATIIGLFAASVAALVIFVFVEMRAAEPILPMRLFRSRVFSVCSVLMFQACGLHRAVEQARAGIYRSRPPVPDQPDDGRAEQQGDQEGASAGQGLPDLLAMPVDLRGLRRPAG